MLATKQNAMGADDNYVTDAEENSAQQHQRHQHRRPGFERLCPIIGLEYFGHRDFGLRVAADMVPVWDGANWGCATQTAGSVDWASPGIIGATEPKRGHLHHSNSAELLIPVRQILGRQVNSVCRKIPTTATNVPNP